jgi:ABC-type lipoprotein export system ATPase subunit
MAPEPMITLTDVRRTFARPGTRDRFVALDVPDLSVEPGTCLVVTGPNGAGKSTLLHLLAGMLRPDSGTVRVAGRNLETLREAELDRFRAQTVGVLLQGSSLLEGLDAQDNLHAAMLFAGVSVARQRSRAAQLLERFDLGHRARHAPATLSGGERQKLSLARALANDPPLLLADEPFASLDGPSADALSRSLRELVEEEGRTLVMVSHQPERAWEGASFLELTAAPAVEEDDP